MAQVFVVRTEVGPELFEWFKKGQARIGWSYSDDLDLRLIKSQLQSKGWDSLTPQQQDAWGCYGFLERVQVGDYLVYPHQPKYGMFTVLKVKGEYDYAPDDESIDGDFRSRRPAEIVPGTPISWNDSIVPGVIKAKLGLRGRFYRLYDTELFSQMLDRLALAGKEKEGLRDRVRPFVDALAEKVIEQIRSEFPRHDFSWFCKELFERMGYATEYREGPSEAGVDVLVTVDETPLFSRQFRVGIQAFCYEGEVSPEATKRKLEQLLWGWERNRLDYGTLVTTGTLGSAALEVLTRHNIAHPNKPVGYIDGRKLAELVLKHFGNLVS